MQYADEIAKRIFRMSGKYSAAEVFSDWVKVTAYAISNSCQIFHDAVWREREEEYVRIMKGYGPEARNGFCELAALLMDGLENDFGDILGEAYMKMGSASKDKGQFFTPYHLSLLAARLSVGEPNVDGKYTINEPACGSGGMILAAAQVLKERGVNYQRAMEVVAQDLEWRVVYMCYVQLSLAGIKAVCVQGDTLLHPYIPGKADPGHIFYTPAKRGMLL